MLAMLPTCFALGCLLLDALGLEVRSVDKPGAPGVLCERDLETHAPICTLDPWVRGYSPGPQSARTYEPYVAKPRLPPGPGFDPETTALVFLHISKSGGTTVKEILKSVAARKGWGELEEVKGRASWDRMLQDCSDPSKRARSPICNQAFYSSTNGLGLCDFINKPYCMYVSVLREPTSRQLSSYNYFCRLGREGRKGWQPGWSRCLWSQDQWSKVLENFLPLQLGASQAPLRKLSALQAAAQCVNCPYLSTAPRGVDRAAILAAAKKNLASGAVLPLFLDGLAEGLRKLAGRLKLPELAEEASRMKPENAHRHSDEDPKDLSRRLSADEDLYGYARTVSW